MLHSQCSSFIQVGDQASPAITDLTGVPGYTPNQGTYCLEVYGNFYITSGYKFIGSEFKMHSGSRIFVNPLSDPKAVTFQDNCNIHGVSQMWDGIYISNPTTNSLGMNFVFLNSTLVDAVQGLNFDSDMTVDIRNSNFYNNYISIYSVKSGAPRNVMVRNFSGNNFGSILDAIGNGTMLNPYYPNQPYTLDRRSLEAIHLENINYFNVGHDPSNSGTLNNFRNLHSGIVTNRTNLEVSKSRFENIYDETPFVNTTGSNAIFFINSYGLQTLKVSGLGPNTPFCSNVFNGVHFMDAANVVVNNCQFNTNSHAIVGSSQIVPSTTFSIKDNIVNNSKYGFSLNDLYKIFGPWEIKNNLMNFNSFGGPSNGDLFSGIRFENFSPSFSGGALIENNTIVLNRHVADPTFCIKTGYLNNTHIKNNIVTSTGQLPNVPVDWIGIEMKNCAASVVQSNEIDGPEGIGSQIESVGMNYFLTPGLNLYCNTTDDTQTGVLFNGDCSMSHIGLNGIEQHKIGLQYTLGASTSPPQDNTGNKWLVQSALNSAQNDETDPDLLFNSRYLVNSSTMPLMPTPRNPVNGWFFQQGAPSPGFDCASLEDGLVNPGDNESLNNQYYNMIINGPYPEVSFKDGRLFWAKWNLLEVVSLNPSQFTNYSNVTNWASSQSNTSLGILKVAYSKLGSLGMNTQRQTEINTNISQKSINFENQLAIVAAYESASFQQKQIFNQQLANLNATLLVLDSSESAILNQFIQAKNSERLGLISSLQQISTNGLQESNLKNTILCFLYKVALHLPLDSNYISTLEGVASQCYLEGGPGVMLARAILKKYNLSNGFDDNQLCSLQPQPLVASANDNVGHSICKLYPNPSTTSITIDIENQDINRVEITDIQGNLMISKTIGSSTSLIDIHQLSGGSYLVKIIAQSGEVINKNFIKL